METKLNQLRAAWAAGDRMGALRIAARFPRLGAEKEAITRAWEASQRPALYRQMGRDPDALVEAGMEALAARYGL